MSGTARNVIVTCGDSTASGSHALMGWPRKICALKGPQYADCNLALSGSTAAQAASVFAAIPAPFLATAPKKTVIVLTGTNDLGPVDSLTAAQIYANTKAIFDAALSTWDSCIWCRIAPFGSSGTPSAVETALWAMIQAYSNAANFHAFDTHAILGGGNGRDWNLATAYTGCFDGISDGTHFNDAACTALAAAVAPLVA